MGLFSLQALLGIPALLVIALFFSEAPRRMAWRAVAGAIAGLVA